MNRTTFLQDVYSVVAAIPEGCVVTYGQFGRQTSVLAYGGAGYAQRTGGIAFALS